MTATEAMASAISVAACEGMTTATKAAHVTAPTSVSAATSTTRQDEYAAVKSGINIKRLCLRGNSR